MCHQTVGLVARHLESNSIPTVIAGSARDIIEQCGVPRFLFTDFPLGNPTGVPFDTSMQMKITSMAISMLADANHPRTTIQTPFKWADENWRENFMQVTVDNQELLARAGRLRRKQQSANSTKD